MKSVSLYARKVKQISWVVTIIFQLLLYDTHGPYVLCQSCQPLLLIWEIVRFPNETRLLFLKSPFYIYHKLTVALSTPSVTYVLIMFRQKYYYIFCITKNSKTINKVLSHIQMLQYM